MKRHKVEKQRPRPKGLMDQLTSPKNTITVLPLIDFNPSDESCICSTLLCITEHAKHLNIEILLTNLCELKHLIVKTKNLRIALRVGGQ